MKHLLKCVAFMAGHMIFIPNTHMETAGIDAHHKLIDRLPEDNMAAVVPRGSPERLASRRNLLPALSGRIRVIFGEYLYPEINDKSDVLTRVVNFKGSVLSRTGYKGDKIYVGTEWQSLERAHG